MRGLKALQRIKGLKGLGRLPRLPDVRATGAGLLDLTPEEIDEWGRLLGDYRLAKKLYTMKQQMSRATLPELVAYDWLQSQGMFFTYQAYVNGGRTVKGGAVLDFLIDQGGRGLAWRIQGNYFHTLGQISPRDEVQKATLPGSVANGLRIETVVDLWESACYRRRPEVFLLGLAGIEIGR